jgi:hypothetical protein
MLWFGCHGGRTCGCGSGQVVMLLLINCKYFCLCVFGYVAVWMSLWSDVWLWWRSGGYVVVDKL